MNRSRFWPTMIKFIGASFVSGVVLGVLFFPKGLGNVPQENGSGQYLRCRNSIDMDLIPIAPAEFLMGSQETPQEKPPHAVRISRPFFIAAHKTTQGQFDQVLGRKPSIYSATGSMKHWFRWLDTTRFPVESLSQFDAIEFCNKLSEQERRRPCYRLSGIERSSDGSIKSGEVDILGDGAGYRLPTEAEWEFCARAGTATRYYFGEQKDELQQYEWTEKNGGMHPVGQKKPNPWGLYDTGGLVNEWCEDVWHASYVGAPSDGSAWRTGGDKALRVIRSGLVRMYNGDCRPASRGAYKPGSRFEDLGFRVVLVSL